MRAVVFCGPTLSSAEVSEVIEGAEILPPVSQGDVYRAALRGPRALGIVDGYFDHVPAVWHKEILWAMSQGIHVFGAASMGALRAAELVAFGMVGVGAIFEAYRDGILEDDDEVAVLHGTEASAYVACSDAMVNIRATLERAVQTGVIRPPLRTALEGIAKSLFYPDRSYKRILELAAHSHSEEELSPLRRWLPGARVNQKREDALAMLRSLRDMLESDPEPKRVSFAFEDTLYWESLKSSSTEVALVAAGDDARVLDELHQDEAALDRAVTAAIALHLSVEQARQRSLEVGASEMEQRASELCEKYALQDSRQVDRWLAENRCTLQRLRRLIKARACLDWAMRGAGSSIEAWMLDHLRWTGEYAELLARSRGDGP